VLADVGTAIDRDLKASDGVTRRDRGRSTFLGMKRRRECSKCYNAAREKDDTV
jgi:hypothetical protein